MGLYRDVPSRHDLMRGSYVLMYVLSFSIRIITSSYSGRFEIILVAY